MHSRTVIMIIAALGVRSAFELPGDQSYVLSWCLPDNHGRIMSMRRATNTAFLDFFSDSGVHDGYQNASRSRGINCDQALAL